MSCLIIVFHTDIELYAYDTCPKSFLDRCGDSLKKSDPDEDNGFYDWLRCKSGEIIGVRWFPYEDNSGFVKKLMTLRLNDCVEVSYDKLEVRIFFSSIRSIDESLSHDQDFSENSIYYSDKEKCAISFSLSSLSEEEKAKLFIHTGYRKQ